MDFEEPDWNKIRNQILHWNLKKLRARFLIFEGARFMKNRGARFFLLKFEIARLVAIFAMLLAPWATPVDLRSCVRLLRSPVQPFCLGPGILAKRNRRVGNRFWSRIGLGYPGLWVNRFLSRFHRFTRVLSIYLGKFDMPIKIGYIHGYSS